MLERQRSYLKHERINTGFGIIIGVLSLAPALLIMLILISIIEGDIPWNNTTIHMAIVLVAFSVIFIIVLIIYCVHYRKLLKSMGYNNPTLEPCQYHCTIMQHSAVIERFQNTLKTGFKKLPNNSDVQASYSFFYEKGLTFRLLLLQIKDFNKESRNTFVSRFNRQINKQENVEQWGPIDKLNRQVRVNLFVITEYNDYAQQLMQANASEAMRRVEAILNVVYCTYDGRLFIPTHFGAWHMEKYRKIHELLITCFKLNKTASKWQVLKYNTHNITIPAFLDIPIEKIPHMLTGAFLRRACGILSSVRAFAE